MLDLDYKPSFTYQKQLAKIKDLVESISSYLDIFSTEKLKEEMFQSDPNITIYIVCSNSEKMEEAFIISNLFYCLFVPWMNDDYNKDIMEDYEFCTRVAIIVTGRTKTVKDNILFCKPIYTDGMWV